MTNCPRAGGCAGTNYPFLTQKERDIETGLDYFLARYYSNLLGRFTSIDPDNAQGRENLNDPQGWNAYSYVGNNPLTRTDPDGRLINLQDNETWQRLRNWWYYERPVTDAQLKKEIQQKRDELKAHLRVMDGHEYSQEEIDKMSTRQVLYTYDRYRLGVDAGVPRTLPDVRAQVGGGVIAARGLHLDATGKVHGELPRSVPKEWSNMTYRIPRTR